MSRGNSEDQQRLVEVLVDLACQLNRDCGARIKPDGTKEEYFGHGVDRPGLESAIGSTFQTFGGRPVYPSILDKASSLLINIATGHHFNDGNKRTALHLSVTYLGLHGFDAAPPSSEEGARLVERTVISKELSFEERRINARNTLNNWAAIDATAKGHRENTTE